MTPIGRRTSPFAARLARTLAITGALATGFAPRASLAQAQDARPKLTESQKQEIRDRFNRAERFYYLRKFAEAIVEYEAIYLLSADPVMLYNIAQCHRQADQPEQAAQFYRNYLRNAPTASNRADVEKKIADMERLVEERRRAGAAPRPAATPPRPTPGPTTPPPVTIPPPAATTPPPVSTTPPPADLPVGAPPPAGPDPTSPSPSPGAPAAQQPDLGATQPAQPEPPSRVLPLSLVVGGGVFLATSLVLGGVAASKAREVESAARTRMRTFDGNLQSTQRAGRAASGLAVASGLIGTIALGAGLYYLFWRLPDGAAPEVAVTAGGEGQSRPGPVTNPAIVPLIVPVIGPGYAGAQAQVTF